MPGKHNKRKNVQRFYCLYCGRRLWRLGGRKHFLFYQGASERQQNVIDSNSWIEEFFCGEHGKLWMKVTRKADGKLVTTLATRKDWQQLKSYIEPQKMQEKGIVLQKHREMVNGEFVLDLTWSKTIGG
ncbi:hypothetical protein [Chroococcidiopsis sp. CCMEE 29]|uniref:hypothetical protein n=1 Tax=Chroococcidiopsis sp. CCMEE 29 TaxID=155894 RepID=UPI002020AEF8|nr:hypothetical protein [Chroococcidiopsis sp. CCMEE 29]